MEVQAKVQRYAYVVGDVDENHDALPAVVLGEAVKPIMVVDVAVVLLVHDQEEFEGAHAVQKVVLVDHFHFPNLYLI